MFRETQIARGPVDGRDRAPEQVGTRIQLVPYVSIRSCAAKAVKGDVRASVDLRDEPDQFQDRTEPGIAPKLETWNPKIKSPYCVAIVAAWTDGIRNATRPVKASRIIQRKPGLFAFIRWSFPWDSTKIFFSSELAEWKIEEKAACVPIDASFLR